VRAAGWFGQILFSGHASLEIPKSTRKPVSQDLAPREDLRVREKPREKGKVNPQLAKELESKRKENKEAVGLT
jgi:hypothetical protein